MTQKVGLVDSDQNNESPCEKVEEKLSSAKNGGSESGGKSPEKCSRRMKGRRRLDHKGSGSEVRVVVQLLLQKVLVVKRRKGKVKKVIMRVVVWVYHYSVMVRLHALDLKVMSWIRIMVWAQ
jgi:hypothetical protein